MNAGKIVVLTGAGMSAESGLTTFRDTGGLWENHDIMEVASIDGWRNNPQKVLEFYNLRRKQAANAEPNAGHRAIAELEKKFDVTVITQNVDNLHEKAGSANVIHLHGELSKARSSADGQDVFDIGDGEIRYGDLCKKGSQIRPHIVWFGEMVPLMDKAVEITGTADILIVIGTSLAVYPAAGLVNCAPPEASLFLIDPVIPDVALPGNLTFIQDTAARGTPELVKKLLNDR